jgi:hypothetical protein
MHVCNYEKQYVRVVPYVSTGYACRVCMCVYVKQDVLVVYACLHVRQAGCACREFLCA